MTGGRRDKRVSTPRRGFRAGSSCPRTGRCLLEPVRDVTRRHCARAGAIIVYAVYTLNNMASTSRTTHDVVTCSPPFSRRVLGPAGASCLPAITLVHHELTLSQRPLTPLMDKCAILNKSTVSLSYIELAQLPSYAPRFP